MKHALCAQYQCIWAVHDLEKTNATFQIITGNMYFKIGFIYPAKWIRSLFSSNLCPCGCPLTRLVAVVPLKNVNSAGSSISGTFVFYWFHLELVPWPPTRRREDWCHSFEISVSKQQQQQQLNHESKSRVCLLSPRWLISRSKIQPWFLSKSKGGTRERRERERKTLLRFTVASCYQLSCGCLGQCQHMWWHKLLQRVFVWMLLCSQEIRSNSWRQVSLTLEQCVAQSLSSGLHWCMSDIRIEHVFMCYQ